MKTDRMVELELLAGLTVDQRKVQAEYYAQGHTFEKACELARAHDFSRSNMARQEVGHPTTTYSPAVPHALVKNNHVVRGAHDTPLPNLQAVGGAGSVMPSNPTLRILRDVDRAIKILTQAKIELSSQTVMEESYERKPKPGKPANMGQH